MPVLVAEIDNKVMNASPATIVLIEPNKIKNCFWSLSSVISKPITAACDAPKLGRKVQRGADKIAAKEILAKDFLFGIICFNLVICCSGIFSFLIMLVIRAEEPNKPVRRGRREFFIFRFKVEIPKNPAKRNTKRARSFDFVSLAIKCIEAVIKIKNIANFKYL